MKKTNLHFVRTETCFDSIDETLIRYVEGKHGRFEYRILELFLVSAKPPNGVSRVFVPASQALELLYINIVQLS